jgi:cell division protein FtsL
MAAFVIVGIASLSALLVQSSFQVDELRSHLGALQQQEEALRQQVAERSSPKRVAEWAHEHGMENPQQVVILPISGGPVREEAE